MSGHSRWATIKRKKAVVDAKRGKVFTKLIREISIAARHGGGSLEANPRLRMVVDKAKGMNMPGDNIKRAIQRGTGEGGDGIQFEEAMYEGYGPGGTAILVQALTDNRNRTSSELRAQFSRHSGHMGEPGCVAWMFQPAGVMTFDKDRHDEDSLMAAALDAGADDFKATDSLYEIITSPDSLSAVRDRMAAQGLEPQSADLSRIPNSTVPLEGKDAEAMLKLMEVLEDHDDVQNVFANFDISEKLLESLVGSTAN